MIDAPSAQATELVNSARSVLVHYGEAFLYYASHWARADAIQRFVIVCQHSTDPMCSCGPGTMKITRHYTLGAAFALRNAEVKYLRISDRWDGVPDEHFVFNGIPTAAGQRTSMWLGQDDSDVDHLRELVREVKRS